MPWQPKIEQREHPNGELGVRTSLDEVARRSSKAYNTGENFAKIRTWSINKLDDARKSGVKVNSDRARADVLLKAVQKKLWVPDPVGMEYIPGPHLLACDVDNKDGVCLKGDDCDGLASLLAASFLSVGLNTSIVGHGYDREKHISHVLCAVHIDGKWTYADPSTDLPLGQCVPFTRERVLSVPNVKVICDDDVCLNEESRNIDPDAEGFTERGVFVGVDGVPQSRLNGSPKLTWLDAPKKPRRNLVWIPPDQISRLGQEESDQDAAYQKVAEDCVNTFDAGSNKEATKSAAGCAAEGACAYFGRGAVPAGACGSIASDIVEFLWGDAEEEAKLHREQAAQWDSYFKAEAGLVTNWRNFVDGMHRNLQESLKQGGSSAQVSKERLAAELIKFGWPPADIITFHVSRGVPSSAFKVPDWEGNVVLRPADWIRWPLRESVGIKPGYSAYDSGKVTSGAWKAGHQKSLERFTAAQNLFRDSFMQASVPIVGEAVAKQKTGAGAGTARGRGGSAVPVIVGAGIGAALLWWFLA